MKLTKLVAALAMALALPAAYAGVYQQCPEEVKTGGTDQIDPATHLKMRVLNVGDHRKVCMHITGGDGWMVLGNGHQTYGFGFAPAEGSDDDVMIRGVANANFPAPTITLREGDEVYISLTNVGMIFRPDLFDSHSVHWHGFPQASAVFDGVPQGSITVNVGSTITYYYKVNDPGTYMYHCHVEATEHMEMGMLGMLNVLPKQSFDASGNDRTEPIGGFTKFAYNDGDGSTGYNASATIQMGGVDSNFHDLHGAVQPLPFLELKADFAQINGRGYPMTTFENIATMPKAENSGDDGTGLPSQRTHGVVNAKAGDRVLLHLTNLSVDSYYTVTTLGLPMKVVGRGAAIARGPELNATNLTALKTTPMATNAWSALPTSQWAYDTSSVTLGGGEGADVVLDTTGVEPGTYYLYTTNLNFLSNGANEDRGGLMTTIVLR